jgi:hypothetical protein
MRNGSHISYRYDLEAGSLQRANGRFATGTRTFDKHFYRTHTIFHRLARSAIGSQLGSIGGTFARTLETGLTGTGPADHRTLGIGDGHNSIIERTQNMGLAPWNIFALAALPTLPATLPTWRHELLL